MIVRKLPSTGAIALAGRLIAEVSGQVEEEILSLLGTSDELTLDLKELSYISSNGLRLLLKLKRRCPKLVLVEVSAEVAEIIRLTGIETFLEVHRAPREISLEGCSCIGRGRNGDVYRLDKETIVKLYSPAPQILRRVEQEKQNARAAFVLGVPTALSFDVVRAGDSLGLIFELVEAMSLREVIAKEPGRLTDLIVKSAYLLRKLHGLEVPSGTFPKMSEIYHQRAAGLADLLSAEEIALLDEMVDSIPERMTYAHGDFHRGNLMVQGEELSLIDMADSSVGHPLYDVLGTYMLGMHLVRTFPPGFVEKIVGWDTDTIGKVWSVFKRAYFRTEDEGELAEIDAMMEAYCPLRWLTFLKIAPAFSDEMRRRFVADAREHFFPHVRAHIARFRDRIAAMGQDV